MSYNIGNFNPNPYFDPNFAQMQAPSHVHLQHSQFNINVAQSIEVFGNLFHKWFNNKNYNHQLHSLLLYNQEIGSILKAEEEFIQFWYGACFLSLPNPSHPQGFKDHLFSHLIAKAKNSEQIDVNFEGVPICSYSHEWKVAKFYFIFLHYLIQKPYSIVDSSQPSRAFKAIMEQLQRQNPFAVDLLNTIFSCGIGRTWGLSLLSSRILNTLEPYLTEANWKNLVQPFKSYSVNPKAIYQYQPTSEGCVITYSLLNQSGFSSPKVVIVDPEPQEFYKLVYHFTPNNARLVLQASNFFKEISHFERLNALLPHDKPEVLKAKLKDQWYMTWMLLDVLDTKQLNDKIGTYFRLLDIFFDENSDFIIESLLIAPISSGVESYQSPQSAKEPLALSLCKIWLEKDGPYRRPEVFQKLVHAFLLIKPDLLKNLAIDCLFTSHHFNPYAPFFSSNKGYYVYGHVINSLSNQQYDESQNAFGYYIKASAAIPGASVLKAWQIFPMKDLKDAILLKLHGEIWGDLSWIKWLCKMDKAVRDEKNSLFNHFQQADFFKQLQNKPNLLSFFVSLYVYSQIQEGLLTETNFITLIKKIISESPKDSLLVQQVIKLKDFCLSRVRTDNRTAKIRFFFNWCATAPFIAGSEKLLPLNLIEAVSNAPDLNQLWAQLCQNEESNYYDLDDIKAIRSVLQKNTIEAISPLETFITTLFLKIDASTFTFFLRSRSIFAALFFESTLVLLKVPSLALDTRIKLFERLYSVLYSLGVFTTQHKYLNDKIDFLIQSFSSNVLHHKPLCGLVYDLKDRQHTGTLCVAPDSFSNLDSFFHSLDVSRDHIFLYNLVKLLNGQFSITKVMLDLNIIPQVLEAGLITPEQQLIAKFLNLSSYNQGVNTNKITVIDYIGGSLNRDLSIDAAKVMFSLFCIHYVNVMHTLKLQKNAFTKEEIWQYLLKQTSVYQLPVSRFVYLYNLINLPIAGGRPLDLETINSFQNRVNQPPSKHLVQPSFFKDAELTSAPKSLASESKDTEKVKTPKKAKPKANMPSALASVPPPPAKKLPSSAVIPISAKVQELTALVPAIAQLGEKDRAQISALYIEFVQKFENEFLKKRSQILYFINELKANHLQLKVTVSNQLLQFFAQFLKEQKTHTNKRYITCILRDVGSFFKFHCASSSDVNTVRQYLMGQPCDFIEVVKTIINSEDPLSEDPSPLNDFLTAEACDTFYYLKMLEFKAHVRTIAKRSFSNKSLARKSSFILMVKDGHKARVFVMNAQFDIKGYLTCFDSSQKHLPEFNKLISSWKALDNGYQVEADQLELLGRYQEKNQRSVIIVERQNFSLELSQVEESSEEDIVMQETPMESNNTNVGIQKGEKQTEKTTGTKRKREESDEVSEESDLAIEFNLEKAEGQESEKRPRKKQKTIDLEYREGQYQALRAPFKKKRTDQLFIDSDEEIIRSKFGDKLAQQERSFDDIEDPMQLWSALSRSSLTEMSQKVTRQNTRYLAEAKRANLNFSSYKIAEAMKSTKVVNAPRYLPILFDYQHVVLTNLLQAMQAEEPFMPLLAMEMGLGKTYTFLSLIYHRFIAEKNTQFVIAAPAQVVKQHVIEAAHVAGEINVTGWQEILKRDLSIRDQMIVEALVEDFYETFTKKTEEFCVACRKEKPSLIDRKALVEFSYLLRIYMLISKSPNFGGKPRVIYARDLRDGGGLYELARIVQEHLKKNNLPQDLAVFEGTENLSLDQLDNRLKLWANLLHTKAKPITYPEYTFEDLKRMVVQLPTYFASERAKNQDQLVSTYQSGKLGIYLVSHDFMQKKLFLDPTQSSIKIPHLLVIDEANSFQNPESKGGKWIQAMGQAIYQENVKNRQALKEKGKSLQEIQAPDKFMLNVTGTPMQNRIEDTTHLLVSANPHFKIKDKISALSAVFNRATDAILNPGKVGLEKRLDLILNSFVAFMQLSEYIIKPGTIVKTVQDADVVRELKDLLPTVDKRERIIKVSDRVQQVSKQILQHSSVLVQDNAAQGLLLHPDLVGQSLAEHQVIFKAVQEKGPNLWLQESPMLGNFFRSEELKTCIEQKELMVIPVQNIVTAQLVQFYLNYLQENQVEGFEFLYCSHNKERKAESRVFAGQEVRQLNELNSHEKNQRRVQKNDNAQTLAWFEDSADVKHSKFLILMQQAGGTGLNLKRARYIYPLLSLFNPEQLRQVLARVLRVGAVGVKIIVDTLYEGIYHGSLHNKIIRDLKTSMIAFSFEKGSLGQRFILWKKFIILNAWKSLMNAQKEMESATEVKDGQKELQQIQQTMEETTVNIEEADLVEIFEQLNIHFNASV